MSHTKSWKGFDLGDPVKVIRGVFAGQTGKISVLAPHVSKCFGVVVRPKTDENMPPIVWFEDGDIEKEG